jgi:hypothetical protein
VAANTLIPLKKPEGQLTIYTVKNPAIEKLEEKLKRATAILMPKQGKTS